MRQFLNQVLNWKKYLQYLVLPIALMLLIAAPAKATGVYELPNLTAGDRAWVIDRAEVLSRLNEGKISSTLDKLVNETGNQVRIVTIRHLDYGETAQSFTDQLFTKWFPTPAAQANQTLLVIDTASNGIGIHTGDKAKSLLTDDIANSVVQETVLAPLRQGDKYNQAFLDASDRLVAVLSGQPDPGPPQVVEIIPIEGTFKKAEETDTNNATIWVIGLLIAATVIPMLTYYLYVK